MEIPYKCHTNSEISKILKFSIFDFWSQKIDFFNFHLKVNLKEAFFFRMSKWLFWQKRLQDDLMIVYACKIVRLIAQSLKLLLHTFKIVFHAIKNFSGPRKCGESTFFGLKIDPKSHKKWYFWCRNFEINIFFWIFKNENFQDVHRTGYVLRKLEDDKVIK